MFTGIVEETGTVVGNEADKDGRRITVDAGELLAGCTVGASIAVNGVCLTVEDFEYRGGEDGWFEVFLAEETIEKTYLADLESAEKVNLERAVSASGRFDGHLMQGHVDTTASVTGIEKVGEDWRYSFSLPEGYGRYVVDKGSVALDGISLTVAELDDDEFEIAIVPETYRKTNLSEKEEGDSVHLEVDVVAKYVESMVESYM
ncbi:MAG: riboflavin synthase [Halobacteria archaeon]